MCNLRKFLCAKGLLWFFVFELLAFCNQLAGVGKGLFLNFADLGGISSLNI